MDGKTRVCGLIANPVEHSMSPMMHNFFAQRTGVNLAYVPFKVEEDRVGDAVKGAYALNILGMNVTVPHKQRVMEFLSELDEDARAIGAVNTLVRTEAGYKGYNTDGAGLKRAFAEAGIRTEGEHCLLIGAGGAAKAAAYVLAKGGAAKIHILNRNEARARELAGYINILTGRGLAEALPLEGYRNLPARKGGYLAVQSTSVGMHPHVEDVIIDNPRFYEMIHTGVDIVYTPARTRFMKMVQEAGGRAVNGLDMLLYQGVIAYELWNPQVRVDSGTIELAKQMIENYLQKKQAGEGLCWIDCIHGLRARGGLAFGSEAGGVMLGVRNFWQTYPSGYTVKGLSGHEIEAVTWFYSPSSDAFDFGHYANRGYNQSYYEGYDFKGASACGIAVTSECSLELTKEMCACEETLVAFTESVSNPAVYVGTPEYYHSCRAFGYWSLPEGNTQTEHG